jgi:hypothetical protein
MGGNPKIVTGKKHRLPQILAVLAVAYNQLMLVTLGKFFLEDTVGYHPP